MTEGASWASLKLSPAAPSRSPCLPPETPTNGHVILGAPLPELAPNLHVHSHGQAWTEPWCKIQQEARPFPTLPVCCPRKLPARPHLHPDCSRALMGDPVPPRPAWGCRQPQASC